MTKSEHLVELLIQNKLLIKQNNLPQHSQSPWYIKVLLALAGWLAALFFFGFFAVTLLDFSDNASVRVVIGVVMLLAAYFILRSPQSEFLEHVGLAVSLCGQALITWALFEFLEFKDQEVWLIGTAVQMLLAWFMPSFLHRLFSALLATYAFSVFMTLVGLPALCSSLIMFFCAWLWLHEFQLKQHMQRFRAIAYGLTLGLIMIKSVSPLAWIWLEQDGAKHLTQWADEGLNCFTLLYVTSVLLKRYKIAFFQTPSVCALVATLLIGLASMQAPGLASAIMLIVLSFAASHRVLMGLGIISALFYIAKYYYSVELSLSEKSVSLVILGIILLALTKALALWQQQNVPQGVQPHE